MMKYGKLKDLKKNQPQQALGMEKIKNRYIRALLSLTISD